VVNEDLCASCKTFFKRAITSPSGAVAGLASEGARLWPITSLFACLTLGSGIILQSAIYTDHRRQALAPKLTSTKRCSGTSPRRKAFVRFFPSTHLRSGLNLQ
jgi:hypothetical protein